MRLWSHVLEGELPVAFVYLIKSWESSRVWQESKTDGRGFLPPGPREILCIQKPGTNDFINMANRASVHLFTGVPADTSVTLRQRFEAPASAPFVWLLSQLLCSFNRSYSLWRWIFLQACAVLSQNMCQSCITLRRRQCNVCFLTRVTVKCIIYDIRFTCWAPVADLHIILSFQPP